MLWYWLLAGPALPEYEAWFRRHAWVHVVWVPLATWIWLVRLAASAFGHTIEWRGYRYGLAGRPERPPHIQV